MQCWAWLEAVQGVLLNRAWPVERILWVEWMFSWWLLEETPNISQSSSEVHWAEDFIWWLCFPVTLLLGAEEVIFSLSTKGILERKYEAESSTKLRYSWWGILETVYRIPPPLNFCLLLLLLSPLLCRGWNPRLLYMRQVLSSHSFLWRQLHFQSALQQPTLMNKILLPVAWAMLYSEHQWGPGRCTSAAVVSVMGTVCTSTSWCELVLVCPSVFGRLYIPNHATPSWSVYAQDLFMEEAEGQVGCFVPDFEDVASSLPFSPSSQSRPACWVQNTPLCVKSLWTEGQVHTAIYKMGVQRKLVSFSLLSHSKKQMQTEAAKCVSILE